MRNVQDLQGQLVADCPPLCATAAAEFLQGGLLRLLLLCEKGRQRDRTESAAPPIAAAQFLFLFFSICDRIAGAAYLAQPSASHPGVSSQPCGHRGAERTKEEVRATNKPSSPLVGLPSVGFSP